MSAFEEIGWVRLRDSFDPSGMAEAMWRALGEQRMRPDDPTTWSRQGGEPLSGKRLTKFGKSGPFAGVASSALDAALAGLLGDGWIEEAGGWGRPLVTLPTEGVWDVPTQGWHLDVPPAEPFHVVRMFAYLSDVQGRGGGTLIVEGSHRLAAKYAGLHSRAVRDRLSEEHSWFRQIWQLTNGAGRVRALMETGAEVRGVRVRVVELTGRPGDVVLWHPSLFHAAAPNVSDRPRFMLTHTAIRHLSDESEAPS